MAGIYIHIPYCRKACHYCDFHFSTILKSKGVLVNALVKEVELRKDEVQSQVNTIYFGGGTPSVLTEKELECIISVLHRNFSIDPNAEITLEANPEDINSENLKIWKSCGINRLSIGIQSFSDDILRWMNRNHSALQSISSVKLAQDIGLTNISIDLIYGVHSRTLSEWKNELELATNLATHHVSAYCLTVEEKTVFHKLEKDGSTITSPDESVESEFYSMLGHFSKTGIELYEISNYAKPGFESKHNSNYWAGISYLGLGPGAHSFDGVDTRSWNISNNGLYIKGMDNNNRVHEKEVLSLIERYNESVMTGLRKSSGIMLKRIEEVFNVNIQKEFDTEINKYVKSGHLDVGDNRINLTSQGFLMADRIASEFFK